METKATALTFEVETVIVGSYTISLALFRYESDALMFARAYFASGNGGNVYVHNNETGNVCAFAIGDEWFNISEGANTDGFNG